VLRETPSGNHSCFAGFKVFVHGTSSTPAELLRALLRYGKEASLRDVELLHIHLEGDGEWNDPEYEGECRAPNQSTLGWYTKLEVSPVTLHVYAPELLSDLKILNKIKKLIINGKLCVAVVPSYIFSCYHVSLLKG